MTVGIIWGAEMGDTSDVFSSGGTFNIQSSIKRTGGWALRVNPTTSTGFIRLGVINASGNQVGIGQPNYTGGVWVYVASRPTSDIPILHLDNSSNSFLCGLYLDTTGAISLRYMNGSDVLTTIATSSVVPLNEWHQIEVSTQATATGGSTALEGRLDNVVFGSGASLTLTSVPANVSRQVVGSATTTATVDFYADDVYGENTYQAYRPNSAVELIYPNAAGNYSQWASGTGSTFAEVDEVNGTAANDGDTTYIKTTGSNQASTFLLTSITGLKTIEHVQPFIIVRDEGGVSSISMRTRSGSTNNDTTAQDPGATYKLIASRQGIDPSTSAAWTMAGVNAMEAGVLGAGGVAARVTAVGALVLTTDISSPSAPWLPMVRTPNPMVGPPVLRTIWRPAPIVANDLYIADTNPAPVPMGRGPVAFVGPMPQRVKPGRPLISDILIAPLTDTNPGILPSRPDNYPLGPVVLRRFRPGYIPAPDIYVTPAVPSDTEPGVLPARTPNPFVGPPALRLAWRPSPVQAPDVQVTDTNPGVLPARSPNPMVGPWALRVAWRPSPVPATDLAPVTDTEPGVLPARTPNPMVGPFALRTAWRPSPILAPDVIVTDTNPGVLPARTPNPRVGPPVLRQGRNPTPIPAPDIRVSDTNFGSIPQRMPSNRVGPTALRQRPPFYFPLVEVAPPPIPPPSLGYGPAFGSGRGTVLRAMAANRFILSRGTAQGTTHRGGSARSSKPGQGTARSDTQRGGSAHIRRPGDPE